MKTEYYLVSIVLAVFAGCSGKTVIAEEPTSKAEEPTSKAEEPTSKAEEPTSKPDIRFEVLYSTDVRLHGLDGSTSNSWEIKSDGRLFVNGKECPTKPGEKEWKEYQMLVMDRDVMSLEAHYGVKPGQNVPNANYTESRTIIFKIGDKEKTIQYDSFAEIPIELSDIVQELTSFKCE